MFWYQIRPAVRCCTRVCCSSLPLAYILQLEVCKSPILQSVTVYSINTKRAENQLWVHRSQNTMHVIKQTTLTPPPPPKWRYTQCLEDDASIMHPSTKWQTASLSNCALGAFSSTNVHGNLPWCYTATFDLESELIRGFIEPAMITLFGHGSLREPKVKTKNSGTTSFTHFNG